jgi:hypothetical protein
MAAEPRRLLATKVRNRGISAIRQVGPQGPIFKSKRTRALRTKRQPLLHRIPR